MESTSLWGLPGLVKLCGASRCRGLRWRATPGAPVQTGGFVTMFAARRSASRGSPTRRGTRQSLVSGWSRTSKEHPNKESGTCIRDRFRCSQTSAVWWSYTGASSALETHA